MGAALATEEMSLAELQRVEWAEGIFALRMAKDCQAGPSSWYVALRVLLYPAVHPPAFHFPSSEKRGISKVTGVKIYP